MRYPDCFQETAIVHHRRRLFQRKSSHQRCSTTINRYNPRRFSLAIRPLIFFEIPHGQ